MSDPNVSQIVISQLVPFGRVNLAHGHHGNGQKFTGEQAFNDIEQMLIYLMRVNQ